MSASRLPILLLAAALVAPAAPAQAAWPTSPTAPLATGNGLGAQHDPCVVATLDGGCYVVWEEAGAIRVRRLTPAGETAQGWPDAGLRAGESVALQSHPVAIEDGEGGLLIVWEQGPNAASRDIYSQRLRSDGSIGVGGWVSTGVAVCLAPGQQSRPAIVSDGQQGLVCAWMDERAGNGLASLYSMRLTQVGMPGPDWVGTGKKIDGVRSKDDPFALVPFGTGGVVAAYFARDSSLRMRALTGTGEAAPGWPALGGILLAAPAPTFLPMAGAPDKHGGFYLAWGSAEDGGNVRAGRFTPGGTVSPGWPAGGIVACAAAGVQTIGGAIADGGGGFIVGWEDRRADGVTHGDIYAQRLLPNGQRAPGWTSDGVAAETTTLDALAPAVVTDGVSGIFLVYRAKNGSAPADLRAARLTYAGTRPSSWPAAGVVVTTSPDDEPTPALARDARGGSAYVAWSAGAASRAWLTRLDGTGALGGPFLVDVPEAPFGTLSLGAPAPNPSRGGVLFTLTLAAEAPVRFAISDLAGRRIREPLAATLPAGQHTLRWDGRDEAGRAVPSGLYFASVEAGAERAARRVLIAR